MVERKRRTKKSRLASFNLVDITRPQVSSAQYVDRDLSWLEFNKRVLEQAIDESIPLLERVRFLSIFQSNLDEFFMKRIIFSRYSYLRDGLSRQTSMMHMMQMIHRSVDALYRDASRCLIQSIMPALKSNGISLLNWADLTVAERAQANDLFRSKIFPILTPLAVDPAHPFPHISNLSTSFAISMRKPGDEELSFSRVKIPRVFPDWICLNSDQADSKKGLRWIGLRELVRENLPSLFPNMEIVSTMLFRVTRNIELERDEEGADDVVEMIERELKERRFGEIVKLEYGSCQDSWLLRYLMKEMELNDVDIYEMPQEIDFTTLNVIAQINRPELKYSRWTPLVPKSLGEDAGDVFAAIAQADILVHHPYESFSATVERFIQTAADDPKVRAIKMTLYRTDDESTIVPSLIRAAEAGKEVVCLVELKARFDEERNLNRAQKMEDAGIHVVYGLPGLKIHSKLVLVVRQEDTRVICYSHIGTGNYNGQTAKLYTDLGLFTSNPSTTAEVVEIFNYLTGYSLKRDYTKLLVAPINMKSTFLQLIDKEIENKVAGLPAEIIVKCNGLEDHEVSQHLYKASQTGVAITLIVRGICTLRPGLKGLSENVRVISVVDRLLEHSRIYYFRAGAEKSEGGLFYMGSADWMARNLVRRVEVCVPLDEIGLREKVWEILQITMQNDHQTWAMKDDGRYVRHKELGLMPESSQVKLMNLTKKRLSFE